MKIAAKIQCWIAWLNIVSVIFLSPFYTAHADAQIATAHPTYLENSILKGPTGEAVGDVIFKNEGWTKLSIKPRNSIHGLDGVYVKLNSDGSFKDVLFVESKTESSQLMENEFGKQGSEAYIKIRK